MNLNLVDLLLAKIAEKQTRIIIIGDTMVDRWVHGRVDSCQDGCPKFVQESVVESEGGAANAENCLVHWGVNTSLYGWGESDCPVKTRYVEDGKVVFRADDDRAPRSGYVWAYELSMQMVAHASAVLISDYDKGFMSPEFIRWVASKCRDRGVPCVADCKRDPEVYEGCIFKGNAGYFKDRWERLRRKDTQAVTTVGGYPYVVWDRGVISSCTNLGPVVNCVNHVGAGDCFAAHLTLALAYGLSLKDAAAVAYSAGRVYVQFPHNRPPLPAEISADMSSAM